MSSQPRRPTGSQHQHPAHGFRPDPDDWAAAAARLEADGRTVGTYLRACLRFIASDPDAALAALAPHWPEPRLTGRPRGSQPRPASTDAPHS
jgi:hypothetical protein